MTDNELRLLMNSDSNKGTEALYNQYSQYIYAIIFRILRDCGSREDVEDCFAETFAEIVRRFNNIRGEALKSYIGKAAQNRALNYRAFLQKKQINTVSLEITAEPLSENMQDIHENKAKQQYLLQKIKELGEPDATIIIQKYYFGRKMTEIAEMTGVPLGTVLWRYRKAIARLRDILNGGEK